MSNRAKCLLAQPGSQRGVTKAYEPRKFLLDMDDYLKIANG